MPKVIVAQSICQGKPLVAAGKLGLWCSTTGGQKARIRPRMVSLQSGAICPCANYRSRSAFRRAKPELSSIGNQFIPSFMPRRNAVIVDTDRTRRPDDRMTKRRNMDGPPTDSPQRGEPGPVSFALALIIGVFLALYVASNGDSRITYVPYVQQLLPSWPTRSSEIRPGDWPAWLFNRDEETRLKSQVSLDEE